MGLLELFILAIGLSMDAFAVSICKGLALPKINLKSAGIVGLWFGAFQALMPLIGYLLGVNFRSYIVSVDHWIAFVLLALIGANMIKEALSDDDEVVSMNLSDEGTDLLVVSENGLGKRTDITEYRSQIRAGKGIKTYNNSEKTGKIVGAEMVNEDDEIMIINSDGVLIRLRVDDISVFGRVTSGVKLMKTDDEVNVVSIAKINTDEEE